MNILLTTISLDSRKGGGTAERTRRLSIHLAAKGHRCEVATMQDGDLAQMLRQCGIPVYATGSVRLRFTVPFINPFRLAQSVRRADALHILGYWNLLSVVTAFLASRLGKPYAFSAAGEFVGLERPRPIARLFHLLFGKRMIRNANLLVAVTALERRQILERFKLPEDRVIVVPNGVEEYVAVSDQLSQPDAPYVLFVGRLAEVKGPDLLVQAFADVAPEYPDVRLIVAGPDFGMRSRLEALATERQLGNRVVFAGHLAERDRTDAYRRALLLAVPSRAEAMSLVALEAGVAGAPVLLTDQCGFDEVESVGGGLVVPATVVGLRDGLHAMLAERGSLRSKGQALQSYVRGKFTWPSIVDGLVSEIDKMIRNRPA
ncbi:glycosyltransferase [Mesorhizobium sp. WSM3866]|uniref:glycosyltransferase family 4 protein n=1 Tax=Mesorhizobium sp. WSM3866 TaxID=422271 RepID=UPI000BAF361D|nr:glycosyltransferase family 4 protein [Mesorhizobium sp. WSM3866]PBB40625.1 glycosyltransferase [Mesorhizobium sp. WSM3866]